MSKKVKKIFRRWNQSISQTNILLPKWNMKFFKIETKTVFWALPILMGLLVIGILYHLMHRLFLSSDPSMNRLSIRNVAQAEDRAWYRDMDESLYINTRSSHLYQPVMKDHFIDHSKKENIHSVSAIQTQYLPVPASSSKRRLQMGTMIPCILDTEIRSDLAGEVMAHVRWDIYDSDAFRFLCIPKGSKIIGQYDEQTHYGQERLGVIWNYLLLPNGKTISLGSMMSYDASGKAGMKDAVDHHTGKIFKSAVLMGFLGGGVRYVTQKPSKNHAEHTQDIFSQSLAQQSLEVGGRWMDKDMNLKPTLSIRSGCFFHIRLNRTIEFESPV